MGGVSCVMTARSLAVFSCQKQAVHAQRCSRQAGNRWRWFASILWGLPDGCSDAWCSAVRQCTAVVCHCAGGLMAVSTADDAVYPWRLHGRAGKPRTRRTLDRVAVAGAPAMPVHADRISRLVRRCIDGLVRCRIGGLAGWNIACRIGNLAWPGNRRLLRILAGIGSLQPGAGHHCMDIVHGNSSCRRVLRS